MAEKRRRGEREEEGWWITYTHAGESAVGRGRRWHCEGGGKVPKLLLQDELDAAKM